MAAFFLEAEKRGFSVEPLSRKSANINGKFCVQRQACWHELRIDKYRNKYRYRYVSLRRPTGRVEGQFDICAWQLPDGGFLILPKELADFTQTLFNRNESKRFGTYSTSHHYREYIERWSVLGQPVRANDSDGAAG